MNAMRYERVDIISQLQHAFPLFLEGLELASSEYRASRVTDLKAGRCVYESDLTQALRFQNGITDFFRRNFASGKVRFHEAHNSNFLLADAGDLGTICLRWYKIGKNGEPCKSDTERSDSFYRQVNILPQIIQNRCINLILCYYPTEDKLGIDVPKTQIRCYVRKDYYPWHYYLVSGEWEQQVPIFEPEEIDPTITPKVRIKPSADDDFQIAV